MPFHDQKTRLAQVLSTLFGHPELTQKFFWAELASPPQATFGYIALACFKIAKILGRTNSDIAKIVVTSMNNHGFEASVTGPYVNFKWDLNRFYQTTISQIFNLAERYGSDTMGLDQTIVLEYCSPNIAKKLFFQHIRSTLIGNTLANVYGFLGYRTERINFVGDWGAQFARLITAFETWGDISRLEIRNVDDSMSHLFDLYVRFHKEAEDHPEFLERSQHCLARLESGEPALVNLWRRVREISLCSMENTLRRLGIRFDHVEGEALYLLKMEETLRQVKEQALARISEGAWIVDLPHLSTPALIQKRDGTTLYLTRDIAAAMDRYQRFHFHRMLYVVSEQQRLHFQQLFGVLKTMGVAWSDACEHLSFGTVLFGSERMSSREGNVVVLDEVLDQAKQLALDLCMKNAELPDPHVVAEKVGIGAIVFGELSAHRSRDIEFDFKRVLSLEGDTGPYVQYALVRCRSLLEKARQRKESLDPHYPGKYFFAPEEELLVLELSKVRDTLHHVIRDNEPYHLTHFLIDLAKALNRFYYQLPVLQATDPVQKGVRLTLIQGTEQCLRNGLGLLNIPCPTEM